MIFDRKSIGFKIKRIRELKGLKREYVSEYLGASLSNYGRLERGQTDVSFQDMEKLSSLFAMTIDEIKQFDEKIVFNSYDKYCILSSGNISDVNYSNVEFSKLIESMEKTILAQKDTIEALKTSLRLMEDKLKK